MPAPFTSAQLGEVQLELMRLAADGVRDRRAFEAVVRKIETLDPEGSYMAVGLGLGFGLTICKLTGLEPEADPTGEGWGFELVRHDDGQPVDNPDTLEMSPLGRGIIQATRVVIACANGQTETARDLILAACAEPPAMAHLLTGLMHVYRGARMHGGELWQ